MTLFTLCVLIIVALQQTVFSGYALLSIFYMNMLFQLYASGNHNLLVITLLSISIIVLVSLLIVRSYAPSVSATTNSLIISMSSSVYLVDISMEYQLIIICLVVICSLAVIHGYTLILVYKISCL